MKKILTILIAFLFLPLTASASLKFGAATTDHMTMSDQACNRNKTPITVIEWVYGDSLATTNDVIWGRSPTGGGGNADRIQISTTGGTFRVVRTYSSTSTNYSYNNAFSTGKWQYVAIVIDGNAASGSQVFAYMGDRSTLASQLSLATNVNSSGTLHNETGHPIQIGNRATDDINYSQAYTGKIAFVGEWNAALTLPQIQAIQFRPTPTPTNFLDTFPGLSGTGNQPDLSGCGATSTIVGATWSPNVTLGFNSLNL